MSTSAIETLVATETVMHVEDIRLKSVFNAAKSIEIENVTVNFKTPKGVYTAVKEISLTVKKGEIVTLIGHSGCGKSTLMGTISGMVRPTYGSVKANGNIVSRPGPDRLSGTPDRVAGSLPTPTARAENALRSRTR